MQSGKHFASQLKLSPSASFCCERSIKVQDKQWWLTRVLVRRAYRKKDYVNKIWNTNRFELNGIDSGRRANFFSLFWPRYLKFGYLFNSHAIGESLVKNQPEVDEPLTWLCWKKKIFFQLKRCGKLSLNVFEHCDHRSSKRKFDDDLNWSKNSLNIHSLNGVLYILFTRRGVQI